MTTAPSPPPSSHVHTQNAANKSSSISVLRAERQALVDDYKRVMHESSRLRGLVRLVDYMVRGRWVQDIVCKT